MARTYNTHKDYRTIAEDEKLRSRGFEKIKEYEFYWLCKKLNEDGSTMYRECFSKFDLEGVPKKRHG